VTVERVAGTASLVAAVAWAAGALLYVAYPLFDAASFVRAELVALTGSAVLPPLLAAGWDRSRCGATRVAVWAIAVATLLASASWLGWPVIGSLGWPAYAFLLLGPTVLWLAWMRPEVILVRAAVPTSFLLAMLLASGINLLAFVLLPASVVVGCAWLVIAWRKTSAWWARRRTA
jgi:hypothetical protein